MNSGLKNYLDNINAPWGKMMYRIIWAQIGDLHNLRILDFGSGFGLTANHFAQYNEVIAVEPNREIADNSISEHAYTQLVGSFDTLKTFDNNSFDYIIWRYRGGSEFWCDSLLWYKLCIGRCHEFAHY